MTESMCDKMGEALTNVRVLDMCRLTYGAFGAAVLADLGADVIKIESLRDEGRSHGPFIDGAEGESLYFLAANRGKRGIRIDFGQRAGQEVVLALVRRSDVLIDNYPPGLLDRYGIGYEVLARANPRLIVVACSAFGRAGPSAEERGYDATVLARSGFMSLNLDAAGRPMKPAFPFADISVSLWAAIAALAALQRRQESGAGSYIDLSSLDCQLAMLACADLSEAGGTTYTSMRQCERPGGIISDSFQARDGRWIYVAISPHQQDDTWRLVSSLRDCDRVSDSVTSLSVALAQTIRDLETGEAVLLLRRIGAIAEPVLSYAEAMSSQHARARHIARSITRTAASVVAGSPLARVSEPLPRAPGNGEHSARLLTELLGYDEARIQALAAENVI